ncbi:helix-turn-helix domain-containing protein [uncultured Maribacter sp.]|uniref:helix-turn-helix domain-containing protein n=1 Tax=uncultured Maribacter sp. TaxID=431308 RepID=UPI0026362937|nr:helix-turn-helix domain-containing protein [uncultured Maribacter sp.]
MEENKKAPCPKKTYKKVGFELKLLIIDQIHNGQISINHASNKYQVSRSSIQYWMKKYSTLEQKKIGMSKKDELRSTSRIPT